MCAQEESHVNLWSEGSGGSRLYLACWLVPSRNRKPAQADTGGDATRSYQGLVNSKAVTS
jgi:hypothetical protein